MTAPAYPRAAMNRKLHALLGRIARAGGDPEAVKADLAHLVSGGRTTHSSELSDREHQALVARVEERAPSGLNGAEKTKISPPPRRRLPRGVPALRTPAQTRLLEQLWLRLGYAVQGENADGCQTPFEGLLKEVPTSKKARAKIDELKSRLVRREIAGTICGHERRMPLQEWCGFILNSASADLTTGETAVLAEIAHARGRAAHALAAGGVVWARDIVARHLETTA